MATGWREEAERKAANAANLREWVATILNVYLGPLDRMATDEAINTMATIVECRALEFALERRPAGASTEMQGVNL